MIRDLSPREMKPKNIENTDIEYIDDIRNEKSKLIMVDNYSREASTDLMHVNGNTCTFFRILKNALLISLASVLLVFSFSVG